nr:hypothetical protein [Cellulomonas sp. APG4]
MRVALEETLMAYTRVDLELVLADELRLDPPEGGPPTAQGSTKRALIDSYINGWNLPRMAGLARRICTELDIPTEHLQRMLEIYDAPASVRGQPKNLIFAATGPKPDLVLRDAVNNDVEIARNADSCLVYSDALPADGLRFATLVAWWRQHESFPDCTGDREVGLDLHRRLRASLTRNPVEEKVLDAYARRYRDDFTVHALIPQVYLHYDPATVRQRERLGHGPGPLARQRMDFLILFSNRRRVVIEVDGRQHYASADGTASPQLYAQMVAEDRRLRLAGYEVYRFGGAELMSASAEQMLDTFFTDLATLAS